MNGNNEDHVPKGRNEQIKAAIKIKQMRINNASEDKED